MPLPLVVLLVSGLAVQFAGAGAWTGPPAAKIRVTARGGVDRRVVAQHVDEIKRALRVILAARPRLDEDTGEITVEVVREALRGDAEAAISASVVMSTAMNGCV